MLHRVRAFNTATASVNKIHDDSVARSLGFRGGLVPGVEVFAYLCHLPAAHWGRSWVEGGSMRARFASPVYDGEEVEVTGSLEPDGCMTLELHDPSGATCATASALPPDTQPSPTLTIDDWPSGPIPDEPPAASLAVLHDIALGRQRATFRAELAAAYLDDIREDQALFRSEGVAHPGWLLRFANYALSHNLRLGPWIHVSSEVRYLDAVTDGDMVETRARVNRAWEARGHELVELDVLQVVGDRPVTRTTHTAIFHPRGT